NEITSHITGIVQTISVKKGESVMKDDILIEIRKG
ncbi:MAG: biotin/lipoyl-binding protein, partial [Bacteroidales bacterium]|nr:biotin/lipoyl-binding protein [Bacteroidales bacterium]